MQLGPGVLLFFAAWPTPAASYAHPEQPTCHVEDACIVDEEVQRPALLAPRLCKGPHTAEVTQVQHLHLQGGRWVPLFCQLFPHRCDHVICFGAVSAGQDNCSRGDAGGHQHAHFHGKRAEVAIPGQCCGNCAKIPVKARMSSEGRRCCCMQPPYGTCTFSTGSSTCARQQEQ